MKVTATEFQNNIGQYQDAALQEPVVVTRNGRERLVMMSIEEYRRLKGEQRAVLRVEELSEEELEQILETRVDPKHDHLNDELK